MRSMSTQRASSLPSLKRILPLKATLASCFILSMDVAGAQPADGPGNVFNTATDLPLASSIAGNSSPGSAGTSSSWTCPARRDRPTFGYTPLARRMPL